MENPSFLSDDILVPVPATKFTSQIRPAPLGEFGSNIFGMRVQYCSICNIWRKDAELNGNEGRSAAFRDEDRPQRHRTSLKSCMDKETAAGRCS